MYTVKIITTILNIIFFLLVLFFMRPLKWSNQDERFSIVGFWMMAITNILSIICMWWR